MLHHFASSCHLLVLILERELFESLPFESACGADAPTIRALYASKMKKVLFPCIISPLQYEPLPPSVRDMATPALMTENLVRSML
jgi:hypothetical protein